MNERIKDLRKALNLTQLSFATRIGVKRNTVAQWEIGVNSLSDQVIKAICREFNVAETWLRTGKGEMFEPPPKNSIDALSVEYNLNSFGRSVIEKMVNLNDKQWAALADLVDTILSDVHHPEPLNPPIIEQNQLSELADAQNDESDIVAELAELKRQNQALAAKIAAMEEEDAAQKSTQANAG